MLFTRWALEMLVMISLVAGALRLWTDWPDIKPPIWRWIILAYQGTVAANAAAILHSITENREITPFTWALISSYSFLLVPLIAYPLLSQTKILKHPAA